MRTDLFEFLDGLFRGVVYFAYNIIETLFRLARHPFRGPAQLYRRNQQAKVRQLSGPTFLFLAFATFFAVHIAGYGAADYEWRRVPDPIGAGGASGTRVPEFDADWVWLIVATGLTATVIVDAALRLFVWIALPRTPARRRLTVAATEFALLWPILALVLLSTNPDTLSRLSMALIEIPRTISLATAGVLLTLLVLVVPASMQIASGLRRRWRWQPAFLTGAAVTLLAVLLFIAASAGARIGYGIVERRMAEHVREYETALLVLDSRCRIEGSSFRADAVVWSRAEEPIVLRSFEVLVANDMENGFVDQNDVERAIRYQASLVDPPEEFFILRPGEARTIRLRLDGPEVGREDAGKYCAISIERPDQGAAELEGLVMRGHPSVIEFIDSTPQ